MTTGLLPNLIPDLVTATIPSPEQGVWHIGGFPLRGYALCIILGIVVAIWLGERRWQARGGAYGEIQDVAIWAVPFGLVGARAYHVATDWEKYFGADGSPVEALYVWHGGLGIWGGVAGGVLGAWLAARRKGLRFTALLDTLGPTVLVAQAIGRWGNWFNQELYGKPTDLPWGLEIDSAHFSGAYLDSPEYHAAMQANDGFPPDVATFHPTFLYECLWNLAAFALLVWLERRFRLGRGRVMAIYVMLYTLGRSWNEYLRIDDVQLNDVLGLRFNVWTSIVLFAAAAAYLAWSLRNRPPGREESVYVDGREPAADDTGDATDDATGDATDEVTGEGTDGTGEDTDDTGEDTDGSDVSDTSASDD